MKTKINYYLTKIFGNKIIFVAATSKNNPDKLVNIVYGSKGNKWTDSVMIAENLKLYGLELKAVTRRRTKRVTIAAGFHNLNNF